VPTQLAQVLIHGVAAPPRSASNTALQAHGKWLCPSSNKALYVSKATAALPCSLTRHPNGTARPRELRDKRMRPEVFHNLEVSKATETACPSRAPQRARSRGQRAAAPCGGYGQASGASGVQAFAPPERDRRQKAPRPRELRTMRKT